MEEIIIIRGAGDLASGVIQKFHRSGFKIIALENRAPSFIRRHVSYGMAVYNGEHILEGIKSKYIHYSSENEMKEQLESCFCQGKIPIMVDPNMEILKTIKDSFYDEFRVIAIIDAIIAKKNLGFSKNKAPITIAFGPGFIAGVDAHVVIETKRGHDLGKLIFQGKAEENTGIPGEIHGEAESRVVYSSFEGEITPIKDIGDRVKKDEIIAYVGNNPIKATITGLLRGMIVPNYRVIRGLKIADIDPRLNEHKNCFTISDKARALGGGALEAFLYMRRRNFGKES